MTTIRTIAAYLILFCGLVLTFAVFFGVIAAAALFLGIGWAGIAFLLQVGGIAALLLRAFGNEEEEDEVNCPDLRPYEDEWSAIDSKYAARVLGENVHYLHGRERVS